ncbi:MAG: trypsin-like peptidase domain-containing protein [Pirellulales bacterium]|nr:trypsin-like peptidase domain-containing protein [Pirellulales bacterium]
MQESIRRFSLAIFAVSAVLSATSPVVAQRFTRVDLARAIEQTLVETIATAEKSVVAIARVQKETPGEALQLELRVDPFGRRPGLLGNPSPTDPDFIPNQYATGVVVGREGLILTTYHVLAPQSDYYVTTVDRQVYQATIRAADPRSDLAVLSIAATDLVPIRFADDRPLRKGRIVVALGNPHAIARDGQVSAAWGIVANLMRKAPPEPGHVESAGKTTLHHYGTLIQTDAKLNLGTSGGPLLDLSGHMVGLLTSLPGATGYQREAGYAIPVDPAFRRIVATLKQGREVEYGFLGIQPGNLTQKEILAGLRGMRVERVTPGPGTPAAAGGIEAGDIITAVNGLPILDADHLVLEIGRMPVDSVARITILRRGRRRDLDVRLGKYPVRGRKIVTVGPEPWRGLQVDYPTVPIDPTYRSANEPVYFESAVLVTEVQQESPAWEAGLRPGMSISHVAGRAVRTPSEFRTVVAGRAGPLTVRLTEPDSPERVISPES